VTHDLLGYFVLTIQNLVQTKLALVLEGGYNVDYMPITINSLMSVLKYDYYPNKTNIRLLRTYKEMNYVYSNP